MVTNHVYTVAGAKGGVGKTTTSINLGASLAQTGYSTVTVELDLAMANLVDFLDVDIDVTEATTLHDVLAGEADVQSAIYETETGLSVVPSGTDLAGYAGTELDRLPDVVETLRWHHDVVLLDTPAGLSEETMRPIQLADDVVLVSTPRVASIRNVRNTLELADRVETDIRGLVLTKSGTGASPGADRIADFLDVELLGHVPEDDAVPHSQDKGASVISNAPKSGAAIAYRKIARQLVDDSPTAHSPSSVDAAETDATRNVGTTDGGTSVGQTVAPEEYGRAVTAGPMPAESSEEPTAADDSQPSDDELIATDETESTDGEAATDIDDSEGQRSDGDTDDASTDEHTTDDHDHRPREPTADDSDADEANPDDADVETSTVDNHAKTPERVEDEPDDHAETSERAEDGPADDETNAETEIPSDEARTGEGPTPDEVGSETAETAPEEDETTADEGGSLGSQIRSLFGF